MPAASVLITNALYELGQMVVGSFPNQDKLNYGLISLNRLLASMDTQRKFIFTIQQQRFNIGAVQPFYTIGPGGDFDTERPEGEGPGNGIINANVVQTSVSPEVYIPIYIMNDDQWADLRVRAVQTTISIAMYNDGAFPLSKLYFYGIPTTTSNDFEFFTRQQLTKALTLNSDLTYPPGYEDAIVLTLAERMAGPLRVQATPDLQRRAREARYAIATLNSSSPLLSTDAPTTNEIGQRSYFFYPSGNLS